MNINRRAFLIGLAAVAAAAPVAKSQFFSQFPPGVFQNRAASDGGTVAYAGPGDVIGSASAFWSCSRAYTAAYAAGAGNACDIADASTGLTTCTMKFATNGFADLTSNLCTGGTLTVPAFCTAHTSCVVTKAYEQTGALNCTTACDATQSTNSARPALTFNCIGTIPCMTFTGSSSQQLGTPSYTVNITQPCTDIMVAQRSSGVPQTIVMGSSSFGLYFSGTAQEAFMYAGGAFTGVAAANGAPRAIQGTFNDTSSLLNVDSSGPQSESPGTGNCINTVSFFIGGTSGAFLTGIVWEAGVWPVGFSGPQLTSMNSNQHTQYGF